MLVSAVMANEGNLSASSRHGEVIGGNYVLGHVLGVGGMGVVHGALQRSLERTVAIKVPRSELAHDPDVLARFRSEALAGSRINHENIVRVLDFGEHEGAPFLVMEHVAGPRLGQLLWVHGAFPVDVSVELVHQIVYGLADAHDAGIVHADVKCDNVLIETRRDGRTLPRLIDFGIARFIDESADGAHQAELTGTAEYVAPEVVGGELPTCAADVYAAGVLLYELITGNPPFTGGSASVLVRKLETEAEPMTSRCPDLDIPADLDQIVCRALARDPAKRFATAGDFAFALDELAGGRTLGLSRPPAARTVSQDVMALSESPTIESVAAALRGNDRLREHRMRVIEAINSSDADCAAVAYLELARCLLDDGKLEGAIAELEEGVELMSSAGGRAPIWRLLLTLAALHDGRGDRERARLVTRDAREHAIHAGSSLGRERAERLSARLSAGRASTRHMRPW